MCFRVSEHDKCEILRCAQGDTEVFESDTC